MAAALCADPSAGSSPDPIVEAYKKDLDRTLLRENLKLTVEERIRKLESFLRLVEELKRAGRASGEHRL
jgi:hypothetical protein